VADKDKDVFQRYLDAGIAFTNLTRARAEELVEELIQGGELQGADAKARVEDLLERSRRGRATFVEQVRREVGHQLETFGITSASLEDLARQVADLLNRTAETGRHAAGKRSGAKKAAKKAGKSAVAKKSTAKKSTAKKTTAKKSTAKKSTAKKSTAKKTAAKKSTAKKTAAKKTAVPRTAAPRATAAPGRGPDRGTA
jgi:polyhydroxyalkanoate synthesis regulator phasin